MDFEIAVKTDPGKIRTVNEDYVAFDEKIPLALVCDGMGGHRGGEKASRFAGESILWLFQFLDKFTTDKITGDIGTNLPEEVEQLIASIRLTNRKLFQLSAENENLCGMGTTLAALIFGENFFAAANIGDSRIYRIHGQEIEQISQDHTFVNELVSDGEILPEQAKQIRQANVITRALGLEPTVKIDVQIAAAETSDLFLLCTDGLTRALSDEEILRIVQFNGNNLNHLTQHLIDDAAMRDGADNISVAAVKGKSSGGNLPEISDTFLIVPNESKNILKAEDRFWRHQLRHKKVNQIFQIEK